MPTYDEEGPPRPRAPAPPFSPTERAAIELEARAAYAQAEFAVIAAEASRRARQAREALGTAAGREAFERCKTLHGAAQTAFRIYRRARLAADRAKRAARAASGLEEAS